MHKKSHILPLPETSLVPHSSGSLQSDLLLLALLYILTQNSQINPCLHPAPPVRNPPEALQTLCGGHQPLCHTEIFTRPFWAVFSLIHCISSVFHLPLNFSAHPPLFRARPIHHCPADHSCMAICSFCSHWASPGPFQPSPACTGPALLPRVGCVWGAVLTNRAPSRAPPAWQGAPSRHSMGTGDWLHWSWMDLSDSLGIEAQSFICLVITVLIHLLWTEAGLGSEERADFTSLLRSNIAKISHRIS